MFRRPSHLARLSRPDSFHRETKPFCLLLHHRRRARLRPRTPRLSLPPQGSSRVLPRPQHRFPPKSHHSHHRFKRQHFRDRPVIPTVLLLTPSCKLICGEWSETPALIHETKIDYIIASDTIYTPATVRSFVTAVNQLASKDTVCWLASQKYYFGLGGGIL